MASVAGMLPEEKGRWEECNDSSVSVGDALLKVSVETAEFVAKAMVATGAHRLVESKTVTS